VGKTMSKHFFDYEDGDFVHSISDNMAIDSDGNMMMRISDHLAIDMDLGDLHYTSSWDNNEDND
jgi:hypothetical protein